jgi:hypothetical protein
MFPRFSQTLPAGQPALQVVPWGQWAWSCSTGLDLRLNLRQDPRLRATICFPDEALPLPQVQRVSAMVSPSQRNSSARHPRHIPGDAGEIGQDILELLVRDLAEGWVVGEGDDWAAILPPPTWGKTKAGTEEGLGASQLSLIGPELQPPFIGTKCFN